MRKAVIFLILFAFSLALYSCSEKPEVVTEDPWALYNDWTMLLIIQTHENSTNVWILEEDIYYVLIDKDKKLMHVLFTNELPFASYPLLGYGGKGIGLIRIFEGLKHPRHLTLIEETIKQNNITNAIFSFWIRMKISKQDGNIVTLILAGFDESITNIGANIYGLGMYEGVFDWNGKVTNVHNIIPIASYSKILSSEGDSIKYLITVEDTNININMVVFDSIKTDLITNIYISF